MAWNTCKIISVDTKQQRSQNASLWHSAGHMKLVCYCIMNFNNFVVQLEVAVKLFDSEK